MKTLTRESDQSEFPALETIRRDMDRFFDDLVPMSWRRTKNKGSEMELWAPNTDMSETENEFVVTVDLPGTKKDEIEVNFKDNRLTISGERRREEKEEKEDYLRQERYFGKFVRSYTLPSGVQEDDIKASFDNGVLTVRVPKSEVSKPKTINIEG